MLPAVKATEMIHNVNNVLWRKGTFRQDDKQQGMRIQFSTDIALIHPIQVFV